MTPSRLILLLPLTLACSYALPESGLRYPTRPTLTEHRAKTARFRSGIEVQKRTLDSALRAGDMAAAVAMFAEHAILEYGGDTLHGRPAIQRWLEERLPEGRGSLWTERERLLLCQQGAYERGGNLSLTSLSDSVPPAVSALYVIRWDGPETEPLIQYLLFNLTRATARTRPVDCVDPKPYWPVPELKRTQLTLTTALVGSIRDDIASALSDGGWGDFAGLPRQETSREYQLNASHRVRGPVVVGASIRTVNSTAVGFDRRSPGNSYLTVERESRMAAATLGWQYRNVRLAAGPAQRTADWFILDEYRVDAGYWLLINEWSRTRFSETKTGVLLEGIYAYPLPSRRIFLEARVQGFHFSDSMLQGETFGDGLAVRNRGWLAGLFLGLGL